MRAGQGTKGAAAAPAHNEAAGQDGGQREEKEGEHLGLVQVHRQDDPSEVPGRPRSGILKGFDPLLNLVLDGTIEYMRDPDDQYKLTEDTRQLGLVVCRGTSVVLICPQDGMEAIPNPFIQQQDA
ncbi:U6 snRNA-associated Sm-like protein LSm7 isoform X1 [Balaenoptera ricei]|uniref:U6 snRNA-associated Sm-like protein LSm7 isoform X1 n=1 Tax=Balaenoptera ricei TaxID=2746895 RepID=UPI0028BE34BA|nr:U6 snRNA-associated Sm-like protein LSm7 isoform X1 [Balaenoptera ricei]